MTSIEKGIAGGMATAAMLLIVTAIGFAHCVRKAQDILSLPTQGLAYTPDLFPVPSNTVYVVTVRQHAGKWIIAYTNQAWTQMTADAPEFKQKYIQL